MATHRLDTASTAPWDIDVSGDRWILGDKGSITGDLNYGIQTVGSIDAATVFINGKIDLFDDTGSAVGIFLGSHSASLSIAASGRISGAGTAIQYYDDTGSCTIDNDGLLKGIYGIISSTDWFGADIRNDGTIRATETGITVGGAGAGIINTGVIKAGQGIDVDYGIADPLLDPLDADNATHIVNKGTITGSNYALWAGGVAVNIRNRGTLNGDVLMGDGNDVFNTAGGVFKGVVYGGDGSDVVTLSSPAQIYVENANEGLDQVRINATYRLGAHIEALVLLGKAGHAGIGNGLGNSILGNLGDNALYGLDGADFLYGGKGRDSLTGGADADTFCFLPNYGRDTITDFEDGTDKIYFAGFGGLADFSDLTGKISQVGDDVVIAFNDHDRLIIRDVEIGAITDLDFV